MNKNTVFGLIIGLVIGSFGGFFAANSINRNAAQTVSQTPAEIPTQNQQVPNFLVKEQPAKGGMMPDISAVLDKANGAPNDFDAQIKAGDLYQQIKGFDKAAAFYERANKIKPEDYDLLVKIGNTYFDAKQFEKAAEMVREGFGEKTR